MKKLIYLVLCISLTAISCGVASTLPTAAPRSLIDMDALYPPASTVATMPAIVATWRVAGSGGLNVRVNAGTSTATVGSPLADGVLVVLVGLPVTTANGSQWVEIATPENGGVIGWVNARYLEVVK